MTKDEELKEAREWLDKYISDHKGYLFDSKALIDYHHHRLDKAWVSVKDRLPEKEGFYIIYAESADANSPLIKQVWFNSKRRFEIVEIWENALTHWQPLPNPPKEV